MKNAKMSDVASFAGVSVSTVSHVINGTRKVNEETRRRVLEAIKVLNYSPDMAARSFKTGRTNMIGFIVPDITNSFYCSIIETVERILVEQGYTLIVVNTGEKIERELAHLQFLASGIVDGCLVSTTAEHYNEISNYIPNGFPLVFLERSLIDNPMDHIMFSSERAMEDAVSFLLSEGHRNIGLIVGLSRFSTSQERSSSYIKALLKNNLRYDSNYVVNGSGIMGDAMQLADNLISQGCTAMIVADNMMSYDVMNHLMLQIMRCETIVVGLCASPRDEFNMASSPKIVLPTVDFGQSAAKTILSRIAEPERAKEHIIFESTFKRS